VLFDNTTLIYLISLLWKLGLGVGLDLQLHYFCIFVDNNENKWRLVSCPFHCHPRQGGVPEGAVH